MSKQISPEFIKMIGAVVDDVCNAEFVCKGCGKTFKRTGECFVRTMEWSWKRFRREKKSRGPYCGMCYVGEIKK